MPMKTWNRLRKNGLAKQNYGSYLGLTAIKNEDYFSCYSPCDAEKIAEVSQYQSEDYENIMLHAQQAFQAWRQVPAPKRAALVKKIGEKIGERQADLAELITLETGKPIGESVGEIQEVIDYIDFVMGQARLLSGISMQSERLQHRMYEQWQPLGVVGIVTAFNFPVAVWGWNAMIALVTGNVCVWKPSPKAPLVALAVHKLCSEIAVEFGHPHLFSILMTEHNLQVQNFIKDPRVNLLSFTGSIPVGQQVYRWVAERFGRCILELGGNNASVITASANIDLAISAVFFAAVGTAGQRCTTTRRLLIAEDVFLEVTEKLMNKYGQIKVGDPFDAENHLGPVIDQATMEYYPQLLSKIQQAGGRILAGGEVYKRKGYYLSPAIVELDFQHPLLQEEHFLPVLFISSYTSLKEAIALHNQVKHGLSSSIFSNDLREVELFLAAEGSDCGIVNVNAGTSGAEIGGAFGGEKMSGIGRESGSDSWKQYMRRQTVTINWSDQLDLAQGIEFD
jgi:aldehyde dehydrogenase (NAD+)